MVVDKFTNKLKKIAALVLALVMMFSFPAGVQGFVTERTYVYVDTFLDMPIPDAYQFRNSVYLTEIVGYLIVGVDAEGNAIREQITRVQAMFISPQTQWIYVTEIELDAIIVLDENQELVLCPRTGNRVITHFSIQPQLLYEIFGRLYPDEIHSEEDIQERRDLFELVRCGTCENCLLTRFLGLVPPPAPLTDGDEADADYEEDEDYEENEDYYEEEYYEEAPEEYYENGEEEDDDSPVFITPLMQLRMDVMAILESRGFYDFDEWHRQVDIAELICFGDYYFITGFRRPEGIFVCRDGYFYLADTQNNRVLVANPDLDITMILYMPTSRELGGERLGTFLPIAVVADTAGRISVVARNINNGILQFARDGNFNRFIGAPSVQIDAWTRFWRQILRPEQLAGMMNHVPTEYNNIRIDEGNFIWGTISAISVDDIMDAVDDPTHDVTPIKRLNPLGSDILMRKGERGIWGDTDLGWGPPEPSRIVDVGIGPAGIYTLLDARRGRMFTFNSEGIMLFAFGNIGSRKGNFRQPVAIGYIGHNIAVLDAELREIVIFEPTLYGELIISAEQYFVDGEYASAYTMWARAAEQNANFSHAFHGLGDARFNDRNFNEAMAYFRHAGGDRGKDGYSRALEMIRRDQMEVLFPIMSAVAILAALSLVGWLIFKGIRNYALSDDLVGFDRGEKTDDE